MRRESTEMLKTGAIYYQALEGARQFSTLPLDNLRPVPGARRWDSAETASFTNLAALDASLDLLLRVGVPALARHNAELVAQLIAELPASRYTLASPEDSRTARAVRLHRRNYAGGDCPVLREIARCAGDGQLA